MVQSSGFVDMDFNSRAGVANDVPLYLSALM